MATKKKEKKFVLLPEVRVVTTVYRVSYPGTDRHAGLGTVAEMLDVKRAQLSDAGCGSGIEGSYSLVRYTAPEPERPKPGQKCTKCKKSEGVLRVHLDAGDNRHWMHHECWQKFCAWMKEA